MKMGGMLGGEGFKKKDEAEGPAEDEGEEDLGSSAKKAAVKALFSAMKSDDVDGGIKALGAFVSACGD